MDVLAISVIALSHHSVPSTVSLDASFQSVLTLLGKGDPPRFTGEGPAA